MNCGAMPKKRLSPEPARLRTAKEAELRAFVRVFRRIVLFRAKKEGLVAESVEDLLSFHGIGLREPLLGETGDVDSEDDERVSLLGDVTIEVDVDLLRWDVVDGVAGPLQDRRHVLRESGVRIGEAQLVDDSRPQLRCLRFLLTDEKDGDNSDGGGHEDARQDDAQRDAADSLPERRPAAARPLLLRRRFGCGFARRHSGNPPVGWLAAFRRGQAYHRAREIALSDGVLASAFSCRMSLGTSLGEDNSRRRSMRKATFFLLATLGLAAIGCGGGSSPPSATSTTGAAPSKEAMTMTPATMTMTSSAFAAGASIPAKYTCDGEGVSPPLQWDAPPSGAQSLALIVDDPDAPSGTFVHWVIYGLPPSQRSLPEGVSADERPATGGLNGQNGAGKAGYTPPCPPSGTHRYFFRLYALNVNLAATPGWTKDQLLQAMSGHALGQAELIGTYSRGQ